MGNNKEEPAVTRVLVADSRPMQSPWLVRTLKGRREFQVSAAVLEAVAPCEFMQSNHVDVVLIAGNRLPDVSVLRCLRVTLLKIPPVLLAENDDRELAVNAFRAGAKGIIPFNHSPLRLLIRCITCA